MPDLKNPSAIVGPVLAVLAIHREQLPAGAALRKKRRDEELREDVQCASANTHARTKGARKERKGKETQRRQRQSKTGGIICMIDTMGG